MIIDKKGKLFGKISIIDICIVLVVIIAVVGVLFTKQKLDQAQILADESNMLIQSSVEMEKLQIKLRLKEVRDVTRDAIRIGDEVFLTANNSTFGVITGIESTPAVREVIGTNGVSYAAEVPERYDVTILVETDGMKKADGYYTDTNNQILFGRSMEIKTTTIQSTPYVSEITVVEE